MQLSTLQRFDEKTAKAVLAAAALSQDDVPYQSASAGRYDKEVSEVLAEIQQRHAISPNDSDFHERLQSHLSTYVRDAIVGRRSMAEVRESLGQRGKLPFSAYKITVAHNAATRAGEKEKFIVRALHSAIDVQHVSFNGLHVPENVPGMTLAVLPQLVKGNIDHFLLVDTMRSKDRLEVIGLFRVFPQAVDLQSVNSPLEVLRAFIDVYGFSFQVGGLKEAKMFEQVELPYSEQNLRAELKSYTEARIGKNLITATGNSDSKIPNKTFLVAAYSVDMDHYMHDRRRFYQG